MHGVRAAPPSNPPGRLLHSLCPIPAQKGAVPHDLQPRIRPFFVVLAAAAAGWLLTALFVADDWTAGLIAIPIWLAAGALGFWLAERLRARTDAKRLAESRLEGVWAAAHDAVKGADVSVATSSEPT